jgi:hypothetical protein
MIRLK